MKRNSLIKFLLRFFIFLIIIFCFGNDITGQNRYVVKYKVINGIDVKHKSLRSDTGYQSSFFSKSVEFAYDTFSFIEFNGLVFSKQAQFSGDVFLGYASFGNAYFLKYSLPSPPPVTICYTGFVSSTFKNNVDFYGLYFYNTTIFDGTKFEKNVSFTMDTLYDEVAFFPTIFNNSTFYRVDFMGDAKFNSSVFNGKAIFECSNFSKRLDFTSDTFNNNVEFTYMSFSKETTFDKAKFNHRVIFDNVHFKDSCQFSFQGTTLPDTLCFTSCQSLKNEIDLTAANFKNSIPNKKRRINIYFYKSEISKFHLDYIHFKLLFINPVNHDTASEDETKAIYQTLLKNFKDRGQDDSYEALDKEFQHFLYSKKPEWLARKWGWFLEHWWNFGYSREKVFKWSFLALLFFSCLTFFGLNYFKGEVYKVAVVPDIPKLLMRQTFMSYLKRFWYSFIYTSILFFPLGLKLNSLNFKKLGVVYIFIVYTIGLICVGFIVNFVLQK